MPATLPRTAAAGLAAALVTGCAADSGPAVTVADSAGVEIVTNLPGSVEAAASWSLSEEPVLEIGAGASPDVPLFRVTAVVPLEDGRVAVGTNTPPRVLVFGHDGALAAALGRQGDGPGEFIGVGSVVPLAADSLAVWDPDRRRVSVFTIGGELVREVDLSGVAPMSSRAASDAGTTSGFTHLLPGPGGSMVVFAEGALTSSPEPGILRPELTARRISAAGEQLASYGPQPGMTMSVRGPAGAMPVPFGARTWATTAGESFVVGAADATELRVFAATGGLARIIRWPDGDRPVAGPFVDRWTALLDERPELRDLIETLPRAERFPAYEGVIAADTRHLLVGDYAGPVGLLPLRRADDGPEMLRPALRTPARRWLAFDAAGALAATLETPEGFEPYAVRDGTVWGVFSDEDHVESIRAYELATR